MKIAIIDYGAGNVFSVSTAVQRLGYSAVLTSSADEIKSADKVIFPGVGQAGAAMESLKKTGLDTVIKNLTQPVLGICLGMQMMCAFSEEENTVGLGIFPLAVKKFTGEQKIPHMGWNDIFSLKTGMFCSVPENEKVYFVHSYYVPVDEKYTIAQCSYMTDFSAALHKGNFYGTQFHPEKSSSVGERILKNFLEL
ncbi:MAG: imidazole glycerol phosphate synthase subunit HisH [Flavobacteriales bacterium]|nr:imidazole glycerol phosphate synthase subunit HisH [Flavobacteriales bacterium]